ncbi:hypothetical protein WJX73_010653 [Symbiochloris irregularis]|uniref:Uncharacterized protein n=1 Tax=Symbiochloris irregularis TaxID=706552 RepID=A0AAW1PN49_9CHLO
MRRRPTNLQSSVAKTQGPVSADTCVKFLFEVRCSAFIDPDAEIADATGAVRQTRQFSPGASAGAIIANLQDIDNLWGRLFDKTTGLEVPRSGEILSATTFRYELPAPVTVFILEDTGAQSAQFYDFNHFKSWKGQNAVLSLKPVSGSGPVAREFAQLRQGDTYEIITCMDRLMASVRETSSYIPNENSMKENDLTMAMKTVLLQEGYPPQYTLIAPDLRVLKKKKKKTFHEFDGVISTRKSGMRELWCGSHKARSNSDSDVTELVASSEEVAQVANDPSKTADYAWHIQAFAGVNVRQFFMADSYASPAVESAVDSTCKRLQVRRFYRDGRRHIVHVPVVRLSSGHARAAMAQRPTALYRPGLM